jgi:prolipoprotein diacylglyceryl transferase
MTMLPTYFPSPPQGVWHLGPLPIRAYALFIITGIVVALMIGDRRWAARGGQRGVIYDIALWVVPFGLIGGRLYHLATDWRTYWGPSGAGLGAAFRIWDGGLGIWGAVALGVLGAWIGCRRHGIPLPAFIDAVAPGIILAQAIGRLGNYFNQELYGRETTVPWGLEIFYRRDPTGYIDPHSLDGISTGQLAVVVQPTFLYELIWNVLVFVILIYIDRRYTIGHGRLFAAYVALYCVGRFWVELLRDDTATHIAGVRINSFTSTFVFIGAVVYIVLAPKGREDPESLRGKDHVADESAESEPEVEPADELASVAAASAATTATAASTGDDGEKPKAEAVEAPAEEPEVEEAKAEAVEAAKPEVEEAKAEEPVAEEPEAEEPEVEEPAAEEPEVEEPAAEAVEPEAEEPEPEEPEEPQAKEPEPEEPVADDPEAEEPEAEPETAEPEIQVNEAEETADEAEESEPDSAAAIETKSDEPAAEKAADEPLTGGDAKETRRRWPLRLRSRRSGG